MTNRQIALLCASIVASATAIIYAMRGAMATVEVSIDSLYFSMLALLEADNATPDKN